MKRNKENKKKNNQFPDMTSYFDPKQLKYDPDGSYTGISADMYYGYDDEPIQDADDL
ncbi:MAG: hypothetical protein J5964_01850 [Eubacterium sp.]|nr:hypothetical protein [Eubacterium sp.]